MVGAEAAVFKLLKQALRNERAVHSSNGKRKQMGSSILARVAFLSDRPPVSLQPTSCRQLFRGNGKQPLLFLRALPAHALDLMCRYFPSHPVGGGRGYESGCYLDRHPYSMHVGLCPPWLSLQDYYRIDLHHTGGLYQLCTRSAYTCEESTNHAPHSQLRLVMRSVTLLLPTT